MKKPHLFLINPLNYLKGQIKFPIGFFKFDACDCRTCGNKEGWGISLLFIGVSFF